MNERYDAVQPSSRLYARIWRWHFFAALIVIPFVLWQTVTGVLYLWHRELASLTHAQLVHVSPDTESVSYQQQLATVLEHEPRDRLQAIEIYDDPTRSTAFFFRDANGLPYPAFTNPHTGEYLGSVESTHWIRGLSRGLHGGWPIQPWGSYLLELGASWAIVMALTGLYLWWPRNAKGLAGVLYPRLRSGSRIFWRDLHATVGIYFALLLLAFLSSALPWTALWGEKLLASVEEATGQTSPVALFFAGGDHHHASSPGASGHPQHEHVAHAPPSTLSLDALVQNARAAGARGPIEVLPAQGGGPVNIRDEHPRAFDETWLQLDGQTGAVRTKVVWNDIPMIPKAVSLGIDLHEGRFFGRANQIFNTVFATSLVWLAVTGFMGWYRRRPHGGLSPPPRRELHVPRAVIATGGVLCVLLPLFGLSVLVIAAIDRIAGRFLEIRT
jgi:uncharacterized iron-regulated membrane protein